MTTKRYNSIEYLNKKDRWLTYSNKNGVSWIFYTDMSGFNHTNVSDIKQFQQELVILREDIDVQKHVNERAEYNKRIVFNDRGQFIATER